MMKLFIFIASLGLALIIGSLFMALPVLGVFWCINTIFGYVVIEITAMKVFAGALLCSLFYICFKGKWRG